MKTKMAMKEVVRAAACRVSPRLVLFMALGIVPVSSFAASAARVEFAVGNVQLRAADGQVRAARRGIEVNSGDTVSTNSGRAQLRFSDGAYVSLQPQSEFRIDEYRWEGKADGNERGFFSLLKGGLRTITGLVGRTNKSSYQVNTAVATIGIRGTEYTIAYTNSIAGSVGEGEIQVCNGAGCQPFVGGQSFLVPDANTLPQLTDKKVDLPPPPTNDAPQFVAGDQTSPDGSPAGLLLTGTQSNMTFAEDGDRLWLYLGQTVVFDDAGVPQSVGGTPLGPLAEYGNDGFIAWGRQADSTFVGGRFFITGPATLPSDLDSLKISLPVASYALIGGTTPVGYARNAAAFGKLVDGSLTAYFGLGLVDAAVTVDMGGDVLNVASKGMVIKPDSQGVTFGGGSCTSAAGYCDMKGFFTGPSANRAGIVYTASGTGAAGTVSASGAAAFVQTR